MRSLRKLYLLLVMISGGLLFASTAFAMCTASNQYTTWATMRGLNYSTGADFSANALIFKQRVNGFTNVTYSCTRAGSRFILSVSGGTLVPGMTDTYQSGLPGVGIRFTDLNGAATPVTMTDIPSEGIATVGDLSFYITAVKTGPVTAGMATGSLLPTVQWDITDDSGVIVRLGYSRWNPQGFTLTTPSCTTPDYTYDLGSSVISNSVPNSNWVSTPVTLTGCAAFYGNASDGTSYQESNQSPFSGLFRNFREVGRRTKNIVTMTLSPQIPAVDPINGILKNTDGSGNASGVGVQIARVVGSTYIPMNLTGSLVMTPALGSTTNITFPLAARMIKTAEVVKSGKVDTAVTYTITYQ